MNTKPHCDFPTTLSRRGFLKLAGAGILVLVSVGELPVSLGLADAADLPTDFNAFLRIGPDGRVSCFTGKIEMGQGVVTSLAQMLADELDVPLEQVDMVMGDTDLCPWDMGTFGSRTTRFFGPPLRAAAAEARLVLLELAAEKLKQPKDALAAADGVVFVQADPGKKVSYADLAKGQRIERHISGPVALKEPDQFKVMHRSALRRDGLAKVTGQAKYAGDIQLPGMLYGAILRPPVHGAILKSVDTSAAEKVAGVKVVREGELVAVLHPQPDLAAAALELVQATWDRPTATVDHESIFAHLQAVAPEPETLSGAGNLETGATQAGENVVEATYLNSYVAHAPMEPHTATAQIKNGRVTVWPSSQTPFRAKDEVADALGVPPDDVRIISPFVGGGFGGKSRNLQVVEAARLAKLAGAPVQVAWTRAEEFFDDSFRPAAVVTIRSGADAQGNIRLWDYHTLFAGTRGAEHFYAIPHHRTRSSGGSWRAAPGAHPFATGAWRAPGNNTNTFARESQIDIMAAKVGMDPVAFRMQNLTDERMKKVLQAAAEAFGWKPAPAPRSTGRGFGVALGSDAGTYVASMAEVAVNRNSGEITVQRVLCAQDMGLCINPEGATIQMEGCITMGLGYALREELRFRGGEIFDRNFDTYELPRFSWLPQIETVILERPDEPAQGGGEPAIVTMGAVLANAVFDACGARLLQLPMTPGRVREALKKSQPSADDPGRG